MHWVMRVVICVVMLLFEVEVSYSATTVTVVGHTLNDADIPNLNTLGTGLTPNKCVETDSNGKLTSANDVCGSGGGGGASISGVEGNIVSIGTGGNTLSDSGIVAGNIQQRRRLSHSDTTPIVLDCSLYDRVDVNELSQNTTVNAPSVCTPNPGQILVVTFKSTVSRTLTINTGSGGFSALGGVNIPTKTIAGQYLQMDTVWSAGASKWIVNKVSQYRPIVTTLVEAAPIAVDGNAPDGLFSVTLTADRQFGNPTGTFTDMQYIEFRVLCASVHAVTWDTKYSANSGLTLPTACTGGNVEDSFGFRRNDSADTWVLKASSQGSGGVSYTFNANDFTEDGSHNVVIDYTNAQKVSGSVPGFMTAAQYTAFNKGTIHLPVIGAHQPSSNMGVIDRGENHEKLLFDDTTSWCVWWNFRMNSDYASGLVAKVPYSMSSATTGGVAIGVSVMAVTPGDSADNNTDSYDTVNTCTDATVPGTAGFLDEISCTLTNADSAAAGDEMRVKLCRLPSNGTDTATGNMEVLNEMVLEYVKQ